ncbi:MAG: site-specific integrase [Gemmataceae bacterium]
MGRHAKHVTTVADGRQVGFAPKVRGDLFRVQFKHPTDPGKYIEAATGVAVPKGWHPGKSPPPAWFSEAEKAIKDAYTPAQWTGLSGAGKATWEEAERYFMEDIKRDASERTYRSALGLVMSAMPGLTGPADITPAHAVRFARKYAAEPYRRARAEDGVLRPRSAETVRTTLRNLSVIWARLKKLRLVSENVWADVERPRAPKKLPRMPSEDAILNLYDWLDQRFPGPDGAGWELLKTFVDVKCLAGCRLNDLCQVRSWQFDPAAGTLLITADQDKTHQERKITLPREVVAVLDRLKGPTYLWERYAEDSAVFRPGPRRKSVFTTALMYHAVQSIFREYGKACPAQKVKTHDFRRRAITLTAKRMGGDLGAVARAIPVTRETAERHYVDAMKAYDAEAIQKDMAGVLIPKRGRAET